MAFSKHRGAGKPGNRSACNALSVSLLAIALTACGGGSSNSSTNSNPSITSITATCTPSSLAPSATAQCSATVQGTGSYSSAVTWAVTSGSINSSGAFVAPGKAASVTVTATSTEDTSKSGSTSITVQSSGTPSIDVTCDPSIVIVNATSQCSATIGGSSTSAVTWSATGGSINTSGLFTAPGSAGTVTITATSTQSSAVSGTTAVTVQAQAPPPSQPPHIVMVMEENQSYSTVVRNTTDWPNLNQLIANGALATHYYANTHPSIGNYFMLTTGKVLTNNDLSTTVWNVDNLARHMLAAKIPFRVYAEGITRGYVGGNTGAYLIRHNPFALLSDIAQNPQVANETIWPFSQFATDLANGNLPEFSFIVPNVNDDAHNGTPHQADSWLQTNLVLPLSNDAAFAPGGTGLLIVDFDESVDSDTQHGGGHVASVLWGPLAKTGYTQTSATVYQHQSMLRTIMSLLGLSNPPGAAATAPQMTEFLQK